MTKTEFEELTGGKVTPREYAHIEDVYALCSLDKRTFAKNWDTIGRGLIIDNLVEVLRRRMAGQKKDQDTTEQLNEKLSAATTEMLAWAAHYGNESLRNAAFKLMSIEDIVEIDLREDLPLGKEERRYIAEIMGLKQKKD